MTDDHTHGHRHRGYPDDQPTEGIDVERLRYFTQPADGKPTTRHRRRGAGPGEEARPAEGTAPAATPPMDRTGRARPERITPDTPRRPAPGPRSPRRDAPPRPQASRPAAAGWDTAEGSAIADRDLRDDHFAPRGADPTVAATDHDDYADYPGYADHDDYLDYPGYIDHDGHLDDGPAADTGAHGAVATETETADDEPDARGARSPRRTRRRVVLALVIVGLLVLVAGVGYYGLRTRGVLDSRKDYTNAAGTSDVIVDIPKDSTLKDFGHILVDDNVVGSVKAFTNAAGGQAMSGGFYKLRTEIPASEAVRLLKDDDHRVGRMVVPEGLQLDSKKGIDGKTTPGIFQMIADATSARVNGRKVGVSIEDLEKAAGHASPEELGVPEWARSTVTKLTGDHRRIEGLIAPGSWESIDPRQTPTQILHNLITKSAAQLQQADLLADNASGKPPYQTLVAASVVEREVDKADDYPKVARVILNRLAKGQRLEMDSTANYTADITNIDLSGASYKADNRWNTYQHKGLPITPIGAVGAAALTAAEHPAAGSWLYFVTVDRNGTTLFADTFDQHKRNRERACQNKLLATGCS